MKASEIIKQDIDSHGQDPNAALVTINQAVQSGHAILLHDNNSVLFLLRFAPNMVELHLYTTDSPLSMVQSLKVFIQKIKQSDIKAVYGKADSPQIVRLLKSIGVPVEDSNIPKFNWMARV
jgi:hypothetical protein